MLYIYKIKSGSKTVSYSYGARISINLVHLWS